MSNFRSTKRESGSLVETDLSRERGRSGTQSIERAVDLLRVVAMGGRTGMRLKDIVAASGLAEATVIRIVRGLTACGMLVRNDRSGRFAFGQLAQEFALLSIGEHAPHVEHWHQVLRDLAVVTGETLYLNRRNGFDSVCLDMVRGAQPVQSHPIDVGVRRPLGAGAGGLAMLAVMPEAEVDACIAHNAPRYGYYGLDTDAVRHLVGAARVHGYSLLTGLTIRGVSVVALPVPGSDARLSVGVAGMTARFVPEQLAVIVRQVQERLTNAALAASRPPNATE